MQQSKQFSLSCVGVLLFSSAVNTAKERKHLQAELGDVVYVELPEVGTEVEQGNNFGVVESVKVLPIAAARTIQSQLSCCCWHAH